jgi:branched-chain amino acid transport system substrate-binding protein
MKLKFLAFALAAGFALQGGAVAAQTLKLGVIAPLTGGGAPWGVAAEQAAKILANETNAAGGLDVGGTKYKVEVIAYDDQYKAADSVAAYTRLLNQDGVKLMLVHTSPAAMALKQNVEDDEVVAITSAASRNAVNPDGTYLFRIQTPPDDFMGPFIAWMKDNLTGRKVVLVNPNDETGWSFVDMVSSHYKENGFEVIRSELYERSQKDFAPLFTKIIAQNPEIIDLGGVPPATAGLMVRQAREQGFKGKFVKTAGPSPREILDAAGKDAAEGMIMQLNGDPQNEGFQRLSKEFETRVGQPPNEMIIPVYDGFRVLLAAVSKARTVDDTAKIAAAIPEVLPMTSLQRDELRIGGPGSSGGKQQVRSATYIGEVRNGVPVVVGKI